MKFIVKTDYYGFHKTKEFNDSAEAHLYFHTETELPFEKTTTLHEMGYAEPIMIHRMGFYSCDRTVFR